VADSECTDVAFLVSDYLKKGRNTVVYGELSKLES